MYKIIYKGKVIDKTTNRYDAEILCNMWNLTYGGGCYIKQN